MAHNPKLEIFKIQLSTGTFRTFREHLFPDAEPKELFKKFFTRFIQDLDKPEFVRNGLKQKALTAYNTTNNETSLISFSSEYQIIEGVFEGGKYGSTRTKSSINNKHELESLDVEKIVMDKYYFLLYTPDGSEKGILFVQSYSGDNVTDLFKGFISTFLTFRPRYKKPHIEKYVPPIFIREFLNGSVLKKFGYSETMLVSNYSENPEVQENYEFVVKIELESRNGLPNTNLNNFLAMIGSKLFNNKRLQEFNKGKVYVKNETTGKTHPFEMDNEFDVKPVIYLDGKINMGIGGLPDFDELKNYCRAILDDEIIPNEYPVNAIQEH